MAKKDFAGVIKLRTLTWGDQPGSSVRAQYTEPFPAVDRGGVTEEKRFRNVQHC